MRRPLKALSCKDGPISTSCSAWKAQSIFFLEARSKVSPLAFIAFKVRYSACITL
jgi:hypothetical protein